MEKEEEKLEKLGEAVTAAQENYDEAEGDGAKSARLNQLQKKIDKAQANCDKQQEKIDKLTA